MDERIEKEKVNHTSEMAGWGDDESILKENNQMEWLKGRVKEMSSWSGASLRVLGAFIVLGGPFIKLLAWAAIIWGIIAIVKKEG